MDHEEVVLRYRRGPDLLAKALAGISNEEADFVPVPGKWNIRQIMAHLADSEYALGMRARQVMAEGGLTTGPTLIPFDHEAWAEAFDYKSADPVAALEVFRVLRLATADLLAKLPAEAFQRIGVHPERGTKTLLEWVGIFASHPESHAAQITSIRKAWRAK